MYGHVPRRVRDTESGHWLVNALTTHLPQRADSSPSHISHLADWSAGITLCGAPWPGALRHLTGAPGADGNMRFFSTHRNRFEACTWGGS